MSFYTVFPWEKDNSIYSNGKEKHLGPKLGEIWAFSFRFFIDAA